MSAMNFRAEVELRCKIRLKIELLSTGAPCTQRRDADASLMLLICTPTDAS